MLESIISYLNEVSGNQPMIVSAIMLPITSGLAYLFKDVPAAILRWFNTQLVSTLVISTGSSYQDKAYFNTLNFIEPHSIDWLRRVNKMVAPMWGKGASITSGQGRSFYFIKGKLVWAHKIELQNVDGGYEGKIHERTTICWIGRKHWFSTIALKYVNELLSEDSKDDTKTRFVQVEEKWSDYTAEISKTTLDDLALDPEFKARLREKLIQYREGKDLYRKLGIAHKLTILLYGIPGTGKTALIRAIAGELDYDIAEGLTSLVRLKQQGRRNIVVALDDFDSAYAVAKRKKVKNNGTITAELKDDEGEDSPQITSLKESIFGGNFDLSIMLAAMDGVSPLNDICIILTTNDLSSVDEAIMRDGRVDVQLEIGAVPADTVKTHFTNLYGPLPEIESWSDMVGSSIYQIKERALNDRFIAIKLINHYNNTGTINTVL